MAETLSNPRSAQSIGNSEYTTSANYTQPFPTEAAPSRPRPHSRHISSVEDGRLKPLRVLSNVLTSDGSSADETPSQLPASVDPLSRYIIHRTGEAAPPPLTSWRNSENIPPTSGGADRNILRSAVDQMRDQDVDVTGKKEKKGVSFRSLRRLIVNKREEQQYSPTEENTALIDDRPEGANAQVFLQDADNTGYSSRYLHPPAYIRVRSWGKKERDFNRLFLAQKLQDEAPRGLARSGSGFSQNRIRRTRPQTGEATWAMNFSMDGQYLATAGQDRMVKVWKVLSSAEERRNHEKDEEADVKFTGQNVRLSAPVFRKHPVKIYEGHTAPVLALSWSKNNFLLSSSMDKTVRLWHVSRPECLCTFKHNDYVTSIQFHPRDDRFFLAGSLDAKLRLWSIPDKSVAFWNQLPDMITAVSFTPDGKAAIAGCLSGLCLFYETEGLKYQTQIHVRSTHGKNSKGSKITGIETINIPPTDPNGEVKVLITSNDSRVRLYNLRDKSLEVKFKGNENSSSQIDARFSDDAKYIVCGSEDARVFIWDVHSPDFERKSKARLEAFEAHRAATTVSLFAPARTRQLLSTSEDPLYDLCNPTPVTLPSRAERESLHSSRAPSEKENMASPTGSMSKRNEENSGYIARSSHPDGHIIVTGDAAGVIKVFRQDCAYEKRLAWDTASLRSSKRFGFGGGGGSGSVANNASNTDVGRSRQDSDATQPPGERILSWRQEVVRKDSLASTASLGTNGVGSAGGTVAGAGGDSPVRVRFFPTRSPESVDSFKRPSPPSSSTPTRQSSQQQQHRPHLSRATSTKLPAPHPQHPSSPTTNTPAPPPIHVQPDADIAHSAQRPSEVQNIPNPQHSSPHETPNPQTSPTLQRRNSTEYWRTAWRDSDISQLLHVAPPGQFLQYDSHAASSAPISRVTPVQDTPDGLGPDDRGQEQGSNGANGASKGANGLLGVPVSRPVLRRVGSDVSALTDELPSAEVSEVEGEGDGRGKSRTRANASRG